MEDPHLPCYVSMPLFDIEPNRVTEKPLETSACSASDFLTNHPDVPYTTFLTLEAATTVPMLDFHCTRLLHGFRSLCRNMLVPKHADLRSKLLVAIRKLVTLRTAHDTELQVLPVFTFMKDTAYLLVHASELLDPRRDISPVIVECRGAPRLQPDVKNTAWYMERKPLEAKRGREVSETILIGIDNEGCPILLEGLVTNFFLVTKNLHVFTAPDSLVLAGSKRENVLAACEELAINVHRKPIRLADHKQFEAAFLTNMRKHLVPISCIRVPEPQVRGATNCPEEINLPSGPAAVELISRLRSQVSSYDRRSAVSITENEQIHNGGGVAR